MSGFATYNPLNLTVNFGNIILSGYAEGSMIDLAMRGMQFDDKNGAQGDVVMHATNDLRADATIRLQAESPVNDQLSQHMLEQIAQIVTAVPFRMAYVGGTTLVEAENAWLKQWPGSGYGDEPSVREWTITLARAEVFVGGTL